MKLKFTILISIVFLIAIVIVSQETKLQTKPPFSTNYATMFGNHSSAHDTIIFDEEEFEKGMENLRIELEKLKDKDIHINFDGLAEEMKNLAKELEKIKVEDLDINIDFDAEKFNENMQKLAEELKEKKFALKDFNIDMSELKDKMDFLKVKMKDLKFKLKDMDKELEKIDAFMKELKVEMKKDGLINDENEQINLELNKDEMRVNGVKVPDELYQKYSEMYKKHFGKALSDNSSIHIR